MPHKKGTYLGGVRTVEDVRLRCVIDNDSDCWHLRTARGKPFPKGSTPRVYVYGFGMKSAALAVWELHHGQKMFAGRRAVRMCESHDCCNPLHIKALTHSQAQKHIVGNGHVMTEARRQNLARIAARRRRFTPEQVAEIRQSTENSSALARKFGCSRSRVSDIRQGRTYREPLTSVWRLAA